MVGTNAIDCLEKLFSEMTYYVSSGMLKPMHSLTHSASTPCNVVKCDVAENDDDR